MAVAPLQLATVVSLLWRAQASICSPDQLLRFPGWPMKLDASVYWMGMLDDQVEKSTGHKSLLYDPSKPTVIMMHGWTGNGLHGSVRECRRITAKCTPNVCADERNLAKPWLQKGWNYGIFYWDQFADEECFRKAELKIWPDTGHEEGLPWKNYNPMLHEESVHLHKAPSVGHVCAAAVRDALQTFSGPTVRFLGHSFGGQLAAACAQVMYQDTPSHPAVPQRLVLLDPYFTMFPHGIGEGVRCQSLRPTRYGRLAPLATAAAVKMLWERGVVTELYKGSTLTLGPGGDRARELETLATFTIVRPAFCPLGLQCRPAQCCRCTRSAWLIRSQW